MERYPHTFVQKTLSQIQVGGLRQLMTTNFIRQNGIIVLRIFRVVEDGIFKFLSTNPDSEVTDDYTFATVNSPATRRGTALTLFHILRNILFEFWHHFPQCILQERIISFRHSFRTCKFRYSRCSVKQNFKGKQYLGNSAEYWPYCQEKNEDEINILYFDVVMMITQWLQLQY